MGIFELPEGYEKIREVNLQQDKKTALLVNLGAVAIAVVMVIAGGIFVPLSFEISAYDLTLFLLRVLLIVAAMVVYVVAHELIHGVFIKKYSGKKAKYGFQGLYAFAGSDAYFNKKNYIVIALAPVVVFGVIFLLLNIFLPKNLFWPVYLLQIVNCSGAAGDIYITFLMNRLPDDTLTGDAGISMEMFSKIK